jgi:hypothetical protein
LFIFCDEYFLFIFGQANIIYFLTKGKKEQSQPKKPVALVTKLFVLKKQRKKRQRQNLNE